MPSQQINLFGSADAEHDERAEHPAQKAVELPSVSYRSARTDHLAAAARLAKRMRKKRRPQHLSQRQYKHERKQEGLAICAHLIAHLRTQSAADSDAIHKLERH